MTLEGVKLKAPTLAVVLLAAGALDACSSSRDTVGKVEPARLVVNEIALGRVDPGLVANTVMVSEDGKRIAYQAARGTKRVVVVDGVQGKEYDEIADLFFSPDGRYVRYVAKLGRKQFIVVDGVEGKQYDTVTSVRFSADGKRMAYAAGRDGEVLVVVDGAEGGEYEALQGPTFSPDSKRVAYAAKREGNWVIVVDGVESKGYYYSKLWGLTEVLLQGAPRRSTPMQIQRFDWVFDGPMTIRGVAERDGQFFRVEVGID